jgi:hypothetical protein
VHAAAQTAAAAKAVARRREEEAMDAFRRKLKANAELMSVPRGSLAGPESSYTAAFTSLQLPPSPRGGGSTKSALVLRQRYHKQHVGVADGPGIATAALALARSAVVRRALTQVRG